MILRNKQYVLACVLITFLISGGRFQGFCQVNFTSSNLPILLINTDGNVDITKVRVDAVLKISYDKTGGRNLTNGPYTDYDGKISIKGRGSSSWDLFDKKGYSFETRTELDSNNNVSLLGMPEENDWVLHGPFADKTLMKNAFVYSIGEELGRYTPRFRFCELILNGRYIGVYLLVEKIKRDKNRLDIAKLNPDEISGDDLTGGYIITIDRKDDEYWPPLIDFNGDFSQYNYIYPDPTKGMPQVQKDYIRDYITDFERALLNYTFTDTINGYRSYIDLPSFIDFFIINEWTKNLDAYRLSTYMYKDKDSKGGKLTMGPLWDYNLSCGGVNIGWGNWAATAENWIYEEYDGQPFWWRKFLDDPYYNACFKKRWIDLRANVINKDHTSQVIDEFAMLLDEAKDRNFQIYPLAEPVWGNDHYGFTYAQEVDTLKGYLNERAKWIDSQVALISDNMVCHENFTDLPIHPPPIISSVSSREEEKSILVYPNPFENQISLHFTKQVGSNLELIIYDILGNKVYDKEFSLSKTKDAQHIDLSALIYSGLYIYTITTDGEIISKGKLIKE